MKLFKRLMAVMFALTLTLGMGTRVYAEETTYTITINKNSTDKAAHTYGAYQIFTGKLETVDGKNVLSDIQWGGGVNPGKVITELNKINGFDIPATANAADVAKAISDKDYAKDTDGAQAIADAINAARTSATTKTCEIAATETNGKITGLSAGYYLVKDEEDVAELGAHTRFILEVVKDVTVEEKASVPSVEKKVKEKNDTTGNETGWQDAADYDIGDVIPYQLTGTLPSTFAEFDTYTTYTFTDTLSEGLTPPAADEVTVKVGTTDVTSHFDVVVSGQVITISLNEKEDLRKWTAPALTKDSKIVVEYTATLNSKAKLGSIGNPNTVVLEFSNNPNYDGDGDTGTTPEDKVIVFTYEIKANKVKEDGTTLSGAGFTLYKKVPAGTEGAVDGYLQIGDEINGVTTFEFKGTDAGEYKLVETTVPPTYNKAEDITFTITATYDTEAVSPKLKTLAIEPSNAGFAFTTNKIEGDNDHITTNGIAEGNVVNKQGSTLPSTGGIGTTIFYVLGGLLVAGAGIVLVARKKAAE